MRNRSTPSFRTNEWKFVFTALLLSSFLIAYLRLNIITFFYKLSLFNKTLTNQTTCRLQMYLCNWIFTKLSYKKRSARSRDRRHHLCDFQKWISSKFSEEDRFGYHWNPDNPTVRRPSYPLPDKPRISLNLAKGTIDNLVAVYRDLPLT